MKFTLPLLTLVALAAANPTVSRRTGGGGGGGGNVPENPQDASDKCGDQVVSCCNGSSEDNSSGLISAILGPILANGCVGIGLSAIGILSPLISTAGLCGTNEVKCCSGNKNSGLLVVDLSCSSL